MQMGIVWLSKLQDYLNFRTRLSNNLMANKVINRSKFK